MSLDVAARFAALQMVQPLDAQARALVQGRRSLEDELAVLQQRAADTASFNPLAWVDWARARVEARQLMDDLRRDPARMQHKPLLGAWISVKDLFQLEGAPMAAGTRAPLPVLPPQDSAVVRRLREAGALVFAKTNMHEIALGATGENPWTGDVCNPWDSARQLIEWFGCGRGAAAGACVHRQRYGWFDPHSGGVLRCGGVQAHRRQHFAGGGAAAVLDL